MTINSGLSTTPGLRELVNQFLSSQDVRQSSRSLYGRTLERYFHWLKERGHDLREIARAQVIQYKEDLLSAGFSSLTVSSYITSVRKFYEWTETQKVYPNVARGIKSPKRKQQFKKQSLSPEQASALLGYFRDRSPRDYAIVSLLLRTGLRTIEAVRANVEDITYKGGKRVLLVHGKGRDEKDGFVILTDKAYQPIEAYLRSRGKLKTGEPLFISGSNNSKGERLTTRTISQIAKEGLRSIGLNGREFTAHSLRHTTAVNILRAGGQLEHAQAVLRHSNPATTQIYTASINEERRLQAATEELLDGLY